MKILCMNSRRNLKLKYFFRKMLLHNIDNHWYILLKCKLRNVEPVSTINLSHSTSEKADSVCIRKIY